MKRLLSILALFAASLGAASGQLGSFADVPVEVDAEGETRFVDGVAVAENNVVIRYGDTTIYCDYAEYNPDTRDALVKGHVRVYRGEQIFSGERALYNFETKLFRAADFRGDFLPFRFAGDSVGSMGPKDYTVRYGTFTTSDNSKPDYRFRAKGVRIYPGDRIIFSRVTLYVGETPVFWWPYLWQSLDEDQAFTISPGYKDSWGAFLLTTYSFPLAENISSKFHFDLYSDRGLGIGTTLDYKFKNDAGGGRFRAYYVSDSGGDNDEDSVKDKVADTEGEDDSEDGRYRVTLQHRAYLTKDIYSIVDINVLSDRNYLEDFDEGEFRRDPQPDNVIAVSKTGENYALTLMARAQLNEFQQTTERLPELVLETKRQPFFKTPVFYEGETSLGYYRRKFDELADLPEPEYWRFDTFHQWLYPNTYFGWLSFIPRAGFRGTYYSQSGNIREEINTFTVREVITTGSGADAVTQTVERLVTETTQVLDEGGSIARGVFNLGFEASFKFSREWDNVQSRAWGLESLRHIVQPYTNLSLVYATEDSTDITQIDRFVPSTQLSPLDFPQFSGIDSITDWSIMRYGVRNRWQTKRDNRSFIWLETDSFFDVNFQELEFIGASEAGTFSNFNNLVRWRPLPWVSVRLASQIPLFDDGFYQFNTNVGWTVTRDFQVNLSHRYIKDSPFFLDSNLVGIGGYYRINDHWGFSFRESYELETSELESQRYELHRDLSSWVASLGMVIRDVRAGEQEFGVALTFTLKDIPQISLPFTFDPSGGGQE